MFSEKLHWWRKKRRKQTGVPQPQLLVLQKCVLESSIKPSIDWFTNKNVVDIEPPGNVRYEMFEDVRKWLGGFVECILPLIFDYQKQILLDVNIAKDVIMIILGYVWLDFKNISLNRFSFVIRIVTDPNIHEFAINVWNDFVLYGSHIDMYTNNQKWKLVSKKKDLYPPRSTSTSGYKRVLKKLYDDETQENQVETRMTFSSHRILEQLVQSSQQDILWYRVEKPSSCPARNWIALVRWTSPGMPKSLSKLEKFEEKKNPYLNDDCFESTKQK